MTTSKFVAVPKSTTIKFLFLSITDIALANLSEPICFLFTFIFNKLFNFSFFNSIHLIFIDRSINFLILL